jgi:LacI family transcriptional regulator
MNYLLQLGHRKIALITGAPEAHTARDVIDVYESTLRAAGALPPPTLRADGRFTEDGGAKACERILEKHPDVTAVFAGNDKMALGAMHQLRRRKLNIPTDVSVVGFDDLGHSAFVNPSLTTVHLPLYEVGTLSCERLIERIHGKIDRVAEKLPTHLVVRDSTALAASVQAT